jgi:type III secretion protein K
MTQPAIAPQPVAEPGPLDMLRLAVRHNLHPEDELHPSWLPADWPARHRSAARFGPAGRAVLGELLRARGIVDDAMDFQFDSQLKRLGLMDAASLRRLALYCGFAVHKPLFSLRGGLGAQVRRQARRVADDAVDFVLDRVPQLTQIRVETQGLQQRPLSAGRVMAQRGYRLLMGAVASQANAGPPQVCLTPSGGGLGTAQPWGHLDRPMALQRLQRKLPRRVSQLRVPPLQPRQLDQLRELMLLCIVPERLPQWDWLF